MFTLVKCGKARMLNIHAFGRVYTFVNGAAKKLFG